MANNANRLRRMAERSAVHRHSAYPSPSLKPGQEAVQVGSLRIGDRVDLGFCQSDVTHMSKRGHPVLRNDMVLYPAEMLVARITASAAQRGEGENP